MDALVPAAERGVIRRGGGRRSIARGMARWLVRIRAHWACCSTRGIEKGIMLSVIGRMLYARANRGPLGVTLNERVGA